MTTPRLSPRLAITLGDPRGIGAEVVRKALADPRVAGACRWVVVGPSGLECPADEVIGEWHPRQSAANAGRLAGKAIERAVTMAQSHDVAGIGTAHIDKHALLAGGYDFPGHTEMLSALPRGLMTWMVESTFFAVDFIVTNVPGVLAPRYMAGTEILAAYPFAPVARRSPLSVALYGYRDSLFIGLDSDEATMTDVDRFKQMIRDAFEELREAAGVRGPCI